MQIVLKRIAKKKTYTIGRLYILKDEDVKKRTIESVNKCRGLSLCADQFTHTQFMYFTNSVQGNAFSRRFIRVFYVVCLHLN